ncbi:D-3-phosphoglycerate dehydrogenase [Halorubrum aquaticum]|uniref:D-3-phosphoglycerate dehydrogenase n=1 Tax=Halorubrum aquaticum TaxID=387340 RepID=A0A1I3CYE8_9EURY|nr:C-terminal binding protein [Halorubrum aquaticum]SFH79463.1 D-3-phosphoglycerate dehydrogenase [Halorubrum aquaticum]
MTETTPSDGDDDRPRVVISDTKLTSLATEREVFGDEVVLTQEPLRSPEAVIEADPDAIVIDAGTPMTAEVFDGCSALRAVVRAGVGVDNVDLAAAAANDVAVSNVPDYGTDEVSAHAVALCAALVRGIPTADADTTAGGWDWQVSAPLSRPEELAVGVVGCGRIGRRTVRKADPQFGRVLVHDPYVDDEEIRGLGAEPVGFGDVLRESDVISVHTPLTPETRGMFDEAAFDAMRERDEAEPGTILVNTARGEVVDEDALLAALEDGTVRSAGLDVLPAEPPADDRLTGRDDVVVTPHIAWYSEESKREVRRKAAEEARRYLRGAEPTYRVDPETYGVVPDAGT